MKRYSQKTYNGYKVIVDDVRKHIFGINVIKKAEELIGVQIKPKGFKQILFVDICSKTCVGTYSRSRQKIKVDAGIYSSLNYSTKTLLHELVHVVDLNTNRSISELFYPIYKKKLKEIFEITKNEKWLTPIKRVEDEEEILYHSSKNDMIPLWRAELPKELNYEYLNKNIYKDLQLPRSYAIYSVDEMAACSFEEYMLGYSQDTRLDELSEIIRKKIKDFFI